MSKRRSNEVYRRTAGAILLGLNILEGVAKQRLSTPYCREMKWWTKAYLHAGMRWQWVSFSKVRQGSLF